MLIEQTLEEVKSCVVEFIAISFDGCVVEEVGLVKTKGLYREEAVKFVKIVDFRVTEGAVDN